MELRTLQYFLAVAREQSISSAAQSLHLSQPTISIQLKSLEQELGCQLLVRGTKGSRKVTLTEEGMLLRKRAQEILDLVHKTELEIELSADTVAGDLYIGAGETELVRIVARAARALLDTCPDLHYHLFSGNAFSVWEKLDGGLLDFGIVYGAVDSARYNALRLPVFDTWGGLDAKGRAARPERTDYPRGPLRGAADPLRAGIAVERPRALVPVRSRKAAGHRDV